MSDAVPDPKPFRYDAEVEPGEKRRIRYEIGETYLGDPIEIPVTIINGEAGGPTLFLSAGIHGDELNGVKVVQESRRPVLARRPPRNAGLSPRV